MGIRFHLVPCWPYTHEISFDGALGVMVVSVSLFLAFCFGGLAF